MRNRHVLWKNIWPNTGVFVDFSLPDPGQYQVVAWHEGWKLEREETAFDVLTEHKIRRPIFSDPETWQKPVTVEPDQTSVINFVIGTK